MLFFLFFVFSVVAARFRKSFRSSCGICTFCWCVFRLPTNRTSALSLNQKTVSGSGVVDDLEQLHFPSSHMVNKHLHCISRTITISKGWSHYICQPPRCSCRSPYFSISKQQGHIQRVLPRNGRYQLKKIPWDSPSKKNTYSIKPYQMQKSKEKLRIRGTVKLSCIHCKQCFTMSSM